MREHFARKGYVADVAIHAPEEGKDQRNFHVHIMVTMRKLDGDEFSKAKDWSFLDKELLMSWREGWANVMNRHLERWEHDARIDHRSLKDQGIDREPTIHLGYAAKEMEARGAQSDRMDQLRAILQHNDAIRVSESAAQRAPEMFSTAARPHDLAAETPQQKEARELRGKQSAARAELKAQQKFERDELKKELAKEWEAFRRQSRGDYRAAAGQAYADMGEQFKADWKELYRTTPRERREEAKAALAAKQREALAERRKELFAEVRDNRAVSWETARRVQSTARRLLREEQKSQWEQLQGEWRDAAERWAERREKEFAATHRDHLPNVLSGSMAKVQSAAVEYLVNRANRQAREQRAADHVATPANPPQPRKEPLAEERRAKDDSAAATGRDSTSKAEAAPAPRADSGDYYAKLQERIAREAAKLVEKDKAKERRDDRGGRERTRGDDGRQR